MKHLANVTRCLDRRSMLAASAAGVTSVMTAMGLPETPEAAAEQPKSATITWSRDVPIRYQADVAVIGAGIAGVSAACAAARTFDDAVARGVFYLDGHKPDDDKRTYILPADQLKVPPYQIPLRCLIVRDGTNRLTVGRCFSADQLALSSARVSTTCSMMGQAAGIAAALSAAKNSDPRRLDPADVRRILVERGARLGE